MKTQNRTYRCAALLLAVMLLLTACGGGGNDDTAGADTAATPQPDTEEAGASVDAATMRLVRAEGDVGIRDDTGEHVEPRENLGLYSGYEVFTETASYSWINLDDVKLTKMDEYSGITIEKDGKKLEIQVKYGRLFFNITEPLASDETMNIRTSTMAVGIRGTCGWVEDWGSNSCVYLLEGKVECSAGEHVIAVNPGEALRVTEDGELESFTFFDTDIPDFVLEELDEELLAAVPKYSRFRNQFDYVSEDDLSSEAKELLRRIVDAVQSENWDEAETLALSIIDMEDIAGEDAAWTDYGTRTLYSELDGYRIYVYNWDVRGEAEMSKGDRISTSVTVEIRPESGLGYYIDCASMISEYEQPYTTADFAVGQCENYNWTGSFERNADENGEPVLNSNYWEEEWYSWSD